VSPEYHRPVLFRALRVLSSMVLLAAAGCGGYSARQHASGWIIVETANIRVRTNLSQAKATEVAADMQNIRDVLARHVLKCAFQGRPDRIPVTLLSASQYEDIAPEYFAAFYQSSAISWLDDFGGQVVVPDNFGPDARQIFQHELTHHLVATCFPAAPIWLTEGMAKFVETATVGEGKVTFGLPPYAIGLRARPEVGHMHGMRVVALPLERLPPLGRVVHLPGAAFHHVSTVTGIDMEANYATAWAAVHLLTIGADDLHPRFEKFLRGLQQIGADPEALFARTFAGEDLQARLDAYLRAGRLRLFSGPVPPPRTTPARVHPMTEGEAHLEWAWLWGIVKSERNREHMREHLGAAKADPRTRASAHLLAGKSMAESGDLAGAEREIAEGLARDPDDARLLVARVQLLVARGAPVAELAAAANRLRRVARSAQHLCALALVEMMQGDATAGLALADRGLALKPSSWFCRKVVEEARKTAGR